MRCWHLAPACARPLKHSMGVPAASPRPPPAAAARCSRTSTSASTAGGGWCGTTRSAPVSSKRGLTRAPRSWLCHCSRCGGRRPAGSAERGQEWVGRLMRGQWPAGKACSSSGRLNWARASSAAQTSQQRGARAARAAPAQPGCETKSMPQPRPHVCVGWAPLEQQWQAHLNSERSLPWVCRRWC